MPGGSRASELLRRIFHHMSWRLATGSGCHHLLGAFELSFVSSVRLQFLSASLSVSFSLSLHLPPSPSLSLSFVCVSDWDLVESVLCVCSLFMFVACCYVYACVYVYERMCLCAPVYMSVNAKVCPTTSIYVYTCTDALIPIHPCALVIEQLRPFVAAIKTAPPPQKTSPTKA